LRRRTYLAIPFLILTLSVTPVLGLQSSSHNISSEGTVIYPESQLGVWYVDSRSIIPSEANWVVAKSPGYGKPNLFENPGFEVDLLGWWLYTPPDKTPLHLDILPGYIGKSAVQVSDELGYRGGLRQYFQNIPPNTTFHYKAVIKTVDVEALETVVLHWETWDAEGNYYGGKLGSIQGSTDWTLYETSFTTPDVVTEVRLFPALVYNKGEVWIDEASLIMEGWQPPTTPAILNWAELHRPWNPWNPFKTESDLKYVEQGLKTVPTENFWGIIGPIREEHYWHHIEFNDDVNTTWLGESLLGYPLYLEESPGATEDEWKDEMNLRMIRGFYDYFHPLTKVGATAGLGSLRRIPYYFGVPALAFIREHYDFVILYEYTENLEYFDEKTRQSLQLIDQFFQKQKKFWIITRNGSKPDWELEAIALEMKNCFDRNMVVTCYYQNDPPLEDIWPLMLKAIELYDSKAPYYENHVYGRNLLTGYVGDTYGWVEVL